MNIANPFERFGIKEADYDGTENYGRFVIEPLERGFGQTLGNALRRVLIESLPGASVYAVEVEGARHEFTALEGIEEDVATIILNLKDLVLHIEGEEAENKRLEIDVTGDHVVTAGDIKCPTGVEVVNKDLFIGTIIGVVDNSKTSAIQIKANDRGRAGDTYTADFYTNWSEKFNVKQDDKIVAQYGTKYRVKSIDYLVHYNVCYHLVLERVI